MKKRVKQILDNAESTAEEEPAAEEEAADEAED